MGRVTRPGGVVAACVWDHAGGRGPLSAFWRAVRELDPGADDESGLAGVREGHLAALFAQAGLDAVQATTLTVRVRQAGFESWWETFTLGVGPAGAYLASLPAVRRDELRERCRRQLPAGPFDISATAWAATAMAGVATPAARGSDALLGRGVGQPVEVLVQDLAEHRLAGSGVQEQRHGRAQLQRVDLAEDLLRGAAAQAGQDARRTRSAARPAPGAPGTPWPPPAR